jgi:hypothetical protein
MSKRALSHRLLAVASFCRLSKTVHANGFGTLILNHCIVSPRRFIVAGIVGLLRSLLLPSSDKAGRRQSFAADAGGSAAPSRIVAIVQVGPTTSELTLPGRTQGASTATVVHRDG